MASRPAAAQRSDVTSSYTVGSRAHIGAAGYASSTSRNQAGSAINDVSRVCVYLELDGRVEDRVSFLYKQ